VSKRSHSPGRESARSEAMESDLPGKLLQETKGRGEQVNLAQYIQRGGDTERPSGRVGLENSGGGD